ncbi:MAG: hypothetical protein AAGK78_10465, partial [Planctomycetota bacterium]
EEAHDYRYFPDPDLMPVEVSEDWLAELKLRIGELPAARLKRYKTALGLNDQLAADLSQHKPMGDFLDATIEHGADPKRAAVLVETIREMAKEKSEDFESIPVTSMNAAGVAKLAESGKIAASKEVARKIVERMATEGEDADTAADQLGLIQSTDTGPVDDAIDELIAQNPKPLQQYREGKKAAIGALVGMLMKQGKGFNPKMVKDRLQAKLGD